MRAALHTATVVALAAIGCEATPPALPGDEPPPCGLVPSIYLIDSIDTSTEAVADPSIDVDRNGTPDGVFNWYRRLLDKVDNLVSNSFARAIDAGAITWLVKVETCPEFDHARVTLCQGSLEGDPLAPVPVVSASCRGTAAVGTTDSEEIRAYEGRSSIPISALFDSEADTALTVWFDADAVAVEAAVQPDGQMNGLLGFGTSTEDLIGTTSGALARSITAAISTDPACPDDCQLDPQWYLEAQHDVNRDGIVTRDEAIQRHPVHFLPYKADLDLTAVYEGATVYWPQHDGRIDSASFAARFHARLATMP